MTHSEKFNNFKNSFAVRDSLIENIELKHNESLSDDADKVSLTKTNLEKFY